jgi:hypothetical protein
MFFMPNHNDQIIELLRQFKAVEQMNDDDRSVIKKAY